jgi:hypothetical protein
VAKQLNERYTLNVLIWKPRMYMPQHILAATYSNKSKNCFAPASTYHALLAGAIQQHEADERCVQITQQRPRSSQAKFAKHRSKRAVCSEAVYEVQLVVVRKSVVGAPNENVQCSGTSSVAVSSGPARFLAK